MFQSKFDISGFDMEMGFSYQYGYRDGITAGVACMEDPSYKKREFLHDDGFDMQQYECYLMGFNLGYEEAKNPLIVAYKEKDSEALVQMAEEISSNLGFTYSYVNKEEAKTHAENLHDISTALNIIGDKRYTDIASQIEADASLVSNVANICDRVFRIQELENDINNIDSCYMVSENDEQLVHDFYTSIDKIDEPDFGKYTEMGSISNHHENENRTVEEQNRSVDDDFSEH